MRPILNAYSTAQLTSVDPTPIRTAYRRVTLMVMLILSVVCSMIGMTILNALPSSTLDARIVPMNMHLHGSLQH
jgi:hypothetical protein